HRLNWTKANYLRAETITSANARLVDFQATLPLAQIWGHNKYHKHKPDKYPMNMQQSFNYSIYSSATKLQKIITNSYK
ncbi:Tn3 family transposase, partial [Escherichia coli]